MLNNLASQESDAQNSYGLNFDKMNYYMKAKFENKARST